MSNEEGIRGEGKVIIFPLSPKKILVGTRRRVFTWRPIADKKMYEQLKKLIVDNAYMYVYAAEEDPEIHLYRKRIQDKDAYDKMCGEYDAWYENYKTLEGPLLTKNPEIKT